jgi:hypothetical protein
MKTLKKILLSILLTSIFFVNAAPTFAQESSLKASVRTTDPLKPTLVLTNISTEPCQVVQSSLGTVAITKVLQDGKEITPLPLNVSFDEGLKPILAKTLHTLKPNETVEIPLQILPYQSGHALQAITWSPDAGAFGMMYPLQANKPYTVEVTYSSPIPVANGAPLCGMAAGTNGSSSDFSSTIKPYALGIALIFLLLFIVWLVRSKWRKTAVTTMLIVVCLATGMNKPVQADYSVPESGLGPFDECMALLERYPDITGPVLDTLDGGRIIIHVNHHAENYTTDWPDGTYHIYWDAFNTYNYYSDDGSAIVSTPCDRLFHEMYHVYEMMNGTFSRALCGDSNLETKEVHATRAQNRLRVAMGLLPRTHYGTEERLPEGECLIPSPTPACTGPSCGESTGEPHLKTFDHKRYDFQAAGEFIATRDPIGDFEVQTRQEPWANARDVSMNTAVAMRVGTNRVEVQMHQQKMVLLVNGKRQPLENTTLDGGGTIAPTTTTGWREINAVTVTWPDGSAVIASRIGTVGLDILVDPAQTRAGKLEGLLGNFNENSKDDLILQGSTTSIEPDFNTLYPIFADSWRVDTKTSLFTYKNGKNTETYTDRTFPDKPISAKNLPNRTAAEALCRSFGLIDPEILENCILDVALTGRPEFARTASMVQSIPNAVDYGGKTWTVSISKPKEKATVSFEGKKNEKIFVDITKATLPDQCGNLVLIGPDKNIIANGCITGGRGIIDGTILPETGTYTISIGTVGDNTGTAFVRLLTITDQIGTITSDKGEVIAQIDKPGVTAKLSFNGQAGQQIFVDIPASTLPSQCGGFGIQDPDGQIIASGCVVNGRGLIETILLPTTGTYSVFIDPSDRNTGQATIRLILVEDYKAELTIDGPPVTAKLTKPGSIALLTFSGSAGQRVFVEIPTTTLPSQCGGITLEAPDGSSLDSGCIINGKGNLNEKGIMLPQTGMYTIRINPSETVTGEVTVKVRL